MVCTPINNQLALYCDHFDVVHTTVDTTCFLDNFLSSHFPVQITFATVLGLPKLCKILHIYHIIFVPHNLVAISTEDSVYMYFPHCSASNGFFLHSTGGRLGLDINRAQSEVDTTFTDC